VCNSLRDLAHGFIFKNQTVTLCDVQTFTQVQYKYVNNKEDKREKNGYILISTTKGNSLKSNEYKKWFGKSLESLQEENKLNKNGLPPFVTDIFEHIDHGITTPKE
jgi:hypothetical protein